MSTHKVRIAIIGTGLIGPRHAEAVVNDPDAILTCIVDPSPAAEAVSQKFNVPLYKSVADMCIYGNDPDGAIVCTPNHTHVAVSKELLSADIHVLCEKPISVDIASGRDLISYAQERGIHLLIGHHRRFNRYVRAAKAELPALGRIIALSGLWTCYKPPAYFEAPTEWRKNRSQGGPVLINLVHEVDILQHLFGPIVRVYAEAAPSQRGFEAEEGAAIILRFENGVVGTFILSDAVPSPHNWESGTGENPLIPQSGQDAYRIFGSEGTLSVPDMQRWSYLPGQRSWNEPIQRHESEVRDDKMPFELQVEHFVKVIRGEEKPICSGADGLRALVVCDAVKEAMASNSGINIEPELFQP